MARAELGSDCVIHIFFDEFFRQKFSEPSKFKLSISTGTRTEMDGTEHKTFCINMENAQDGKFYLHLDQEQVTDLFVRIKETLDPREKI